MPDAEVVDLEVAAEDGPEEVEVALVVSAAAAAEAVVPVVVGKLFL